MIAKNTCISYNWRFEFANINYIYQLFETSTTAKQALIVYRWLSSRLAMIISEDIMSEDWLEHTISKALIDSTPWKIVILNTSLEDYVTFQLGDFYVLW